MEGKARLSFTKVAELSGVSEASCRRYVKKAPRIFMAVHLDGVTRFPQEAVERFQAAQRGLSEGLRWGEMMRSLHEQFGAVYDVEPVGGEAETEAAGSAVALAGIESKLDRLVAAVEALAAARQETAELRGRVESLEAALRTQANGDAPERPQVATDNGKGGEVSEELPKPQKQGFWARWFGGGE